MQDYIEAIQYQALEDYILAERIFQNKPSCQTGEYICISCPKYSNGVCIAGYCYTWW